MRCALLAAALLVMSGCRKDSKNDTTIVPRADLATSGQADMLAVGADMQSDADSGSADLASFDMTSAPDMAACKPPGTACVTNSECCLEKVSGVTDQNAASCDQFGLGTSATMKCVTNWLQYGSPCQPTGSHQGFRSCSDEGQGTVCSACM